MKKVVTIKSEIPLSTKIGCSNLTKRPLNWGRSRPSMNKVFCMFLFINFYLFSGPAHSDEKSLCKYFALAEQYYVDIAQYGNELQRLFSQTDKVSRDDLLHGFKEGIVGLEERKRQFEADTFGLVGEELYDLNTLNLNATDSVLNFSKKAYALIETGDYNTGKIASLSAQHTAIDNEHAKLVDQEIKSILQNYPNLNCQATGIPWKVIVVLILAILLWFIFK